LGIEVAIVEKVETMLDVFRFEFSQDRPRVCAAKELPLNSMQLAVLQAHAIRYEMGC
jgi:hypothetical protein